MSNPIKVPALGESITEALVARWLKSPGDKVAVDEPVVELETDKITVEVPSPTAGVLSQQLAQVGATVKVGDTIAQIDEALPQAPSTPTSQQPPAQETPPQTKPQPDLPPMPAARAEAGRLGIDPGTISGSGRGGRVLKEDVQRSGQQGTKPLPTPSGGPSPSAAPAETHPQEEIVPMSPLRRRVAERLVQAQQTAAILTTFNEIDMSAVFNLRKQFKDQFASKYNIKLGFMSFFVKACVAALKEFPAVNAEIRQENIVYKYHYDIGVAVGGGKGLVVPVIRHADRLSFAEIEKEIIRLATRARENKLTLEDLSGGTFTISNGGIYGSMLSTPILNPPQSGILGLHNIVERPVAIDHKVEIRPMMFVALSYDHRLIDGREAVQFLVRVKECIENPERMLLEV